MLYYYAKHEVAITRTYSNPHFYNAYGFIRDSQLHSGSLSYGWTPENGYYEDGGGAFCYIDNPVVYNVYSPHELEEVNFSHIDGDGAHYNVWVYALDITEDRSKGDFIETITAEYGTYPDDGEQDGYWYVVIGAVFPRMKVDIGDQKVIIVRGKVNIGGVLRPITNIKYNIDGELKGGA